MNKVHAKGSNDAKSKKAVADSKSTVTFPWRAFAALAVGAIVVIAGYWFLTRPPEGESVPTTNNPVAVIETNFGTIRVQLDGVRAPRTAGNFISLAASGYFDGSTFHRVAANFVIQGGRGDAPAQEIAWEQTGLKNEQYTISMARRGGDWNSASSEFFINLKDNPNLDRPAGEEAYPYAVFGRVIEGFGVVDAIGALYPAGQTSYDGAPTQPVNVLSVRIQG